jgi:hypothetical protein
MAKGTIYLVRPLYGRHQLVGEAVIGPTWIEYMFPADEASIPLEPESSVLSASPGGYRILIPLTNVTAIALPIELDDQAGGRPLP